MSTLVLKKEVICIPGNNLYVRIAGIFPMGVLTHINLVAIILPMHTPKHTSKILKLYAWLGTNQRIYLKKYCSEQTLQFGFLLAMCITTCL